MQKGYTEVYRSDASGFPSSAHRAPDGTRYIIDHSGPHPEHGHTGERVALNFQQGDAAKVGANGITDASLLAVLIDRAELRGDAVAAAMLRAVTVKE